MENYYELPDYKYVVSKVFVYNLKNSVEGAKYPMSVDIENLSDNLTPGIEKLAQSDKGEGHDQWLTGITVSFDLTFSNKAWVEAERYRFLYFISSQSTMHRISKFNLDESCNDYVDCRVVDLLKEKQQHYLTLTSTLQDVRKQLEENKEDEGLKAYIEDLERDVRCAYLELLYNTPSGFSLTSKMITNYRQLKTIYSQRKNHRLPEWRTFCEWIKTLPESHLIVGEEE